MNLGSFDVPCDPNFKRSDLSSKNDGERGVDYLQNEMSRGVDDLQEELSQGVDDVVLESVVEASSEESVEELLDTSGVAFVVAESVQSAGRAELYNSGCTNHISPYRDLFENFQSITPRHFRAANKQTFSTVGKGDIVIDIPNGKGETQIRLQDVLYSAEVRYTLVSVGSKVKHEEAVANVAEERLTLDALHRCMGHLSLDAARKLLKDKMITSIPPVFA